MGKHGQTTQSQVGEVGDGLQNGHWVFGHIDETGAPLFEPNQTPGGIHIYVSWPSHDMFSVRHVLGQNVLLSKAVAACLSHVPCSRDLLYYMARRCPLGGP